MVVLEHHRRRGRLLTEPDQHITSRRHSAARRGAPSLLAAASALTLSGIRSPRGGNSHRNDQASSVVSPVPTRDGVGPWLARARNVLGEPGGAEPRRRLRVLRSCGSPTGPSRVERSCRRVRLTGTVEGFYEPDPGVTATPLSPGRHRSPQPARTSPRARQSNRPRRSEAARPGCALSPSCGPTTPPRANPRCSGRPQLIFNMHGQGAHCFGRVLIASPTSHGSPSRTRGST